MSVMYTVIISNVSGTSLQIEDLNLVIDDSTSQINISDEYTFDDLAGSDDLRSLVDSGDIVVNNGIIDLTPEEGVKYLTLQTVYNSEMDYISSDTFDANTIIKADTDNTPVALTVDASTFVGRKSTGGIVSMSATEAKEILSIQASDVSVDKIDTPTYDTVQDCINVMNSSMYINGDTFITENNNFDGTIDIAAMSGFIKSTNSNTASLKAFDIDGIVGMSLDDGFNYIYIDYNSGTPIFAKSLTPPNHNDQLIIGGVYKEATTNYLHIAEGGQSFANFQDKALKRLQEVRGFQRANGIVFSESDIYERAIYVTSGVLWGGTNRFVFPQIDTGDHHDITGGGTGGTVLANNTISLDSLEGDITEHFVYSKRVRVHMSSNGNDGIYTVYSSTFNGSNTIITFIESTLNTGNDTGHIHDTTFTYWYYNGTSWVPVYGSIQIDNIYYNNVTSGLVELVANRYGVHWCFIDPDGHVHIVYGQGNYTLTEAMDAQLPETYPDLVSSLTILAAKIIIQKSSTTINSVASAWEVLFSPHLVNNHNELGELQGGTASQYYHLTSTEYTNLFSKSIFDANTIIKADTDDTPVALTISESSFVGRKSTGGIVNLPVAEAKELLDITEYDVAIENTYINIGNDGTSDDLEDILELIDDKLTLSEINPPTTDVDFNDKQATDFIIQNVADQTALDALNPILGKMAFKVDTLELYICTEI